MNRQHLGLAVAAWVAAAPLAAGCGRRTDRETRATAGGAASPSSSVEQPNTNKLGGTTSTGDDWADAGDGLITTASGLRMLVLRQGTGNDHAAASDRVRVQYTGWTKGGTMFDSSLDREQPGLFTLTQVIPGWAEALELMVVGEKRKLWIPAKLAYGDRPLPGAPAGDLTYEVELVEIIHAPTRPEDVSGVPKTAIVTPSGLAYRVLSAGSGKTHPKESDTVVANYSGWTTDGLLFDSTRLRDGPGTFTVSALIRGWKEALKLMVVGDTMRFWMPANLAYGEHPKNEDAPAGMLVFDIELLQIR
jgi:peptidylprolyl isomerase